MSLSRRFPLGGNHNHVGAATNYTSHFRPQEPVINEVRTDGKEGYELPDFCGQTALIGCTKGQGEGVQSPNNFADVLYGWQPMIIVSCFTSHSSFPFLHPPLCISISVRSAVTKEIKLVPLNFVGMWVGRVAGRAL